MDSVRRGRVDQGTGLAVELEASGAARSGLELILRQHGLDRSWDLDDAFEVGEGGFFRQLENPMIMRFASGIGP